MRKRKESGVDSKFHPLRKSLTQKITATEYIFNLKKENGICTNMTKEKKEKIVVKPAIHFEF